MILEKTHIEDYLQLCQLKQLSESTLRAYQLDLYEFLNYAQGQELTKNTVQAYLGQMNNRFKPRTIKRKIASISALLSYFVEEEYLQSNYIHSIKRKYRTPKELPKLLDSDVISKLLTHAYHKYENCESESSRIRYARNIALLELMVCTGMRVFEVCELPARNIDFNNKLILVEGKGNKQRYLPLQVKVCIEALLQYYQLNQAEIDRSGYFFPNKTSHFDTSSVRRMIKKYLKEIHLDHIKVTPHMFRHSFASALVAENVSIVAIKEILGHSDINTTMIYTHISNKQIHDIMKEHNLRLKL